MRAFGEHPVELVHRRHLTRAHAEQQARHDRVIAHLDMEPRVVVLDHPDGAQRRMEHRLRRLGPDRPAENKSVGGSRIGRQAVAARGLFIVDTDRQPIDRRASAQAMTPSTTWGSCDLAAGSSDLEEALQQRFVEQQRPTREACVAFHALIVSP